MRLNAVFRSGVAAIVVLGAGAAFLILGIAGVSWRAQCAAAGAAGICMDADPIVSTAIAEPAPDAPTSEPNPLMPAPQPAADTVDPATAASATSRLSRREQQLRSAGALIAATFSTLSTLEPEASGPAPLPQEVAMRAEDAQAGAAPDAAAGGVSTTAPTTTVLAKRTVQSVPITSDGQPVWPPTASAYAAVASRAAQGFPDEPFPDAVPISGPVAQTAAFDGAPVPEVRLAHAATPGAAGDPVRGRVGDDPVNVRSGPAASQARLFVLAAGAEIEATAQSQGWVRITDARGRTGWAYRDYLDLAGLDALPVATDVALSEAASAQEKPADSAADIRTVKGQGVNVRSGPSTSKAKLFALKGGEQVTVTGNEKGWLRITDSRGRSGWVYTSYLAGG